MAGISQVEAARKYGVSQSQISRWVKRPCGIEKTEVTD